ncbi:hypothetical protein [Thermoanaerobacterium thermosaccharolyticum]|uniref:hypothetical protein n=1 Tax=Thermoanaerobacterium thermosaccharolyticum TaxID=1517 RepID=UPI003DA920B1
MKKLVLVLAFILTLGLGFGGGFYAGYYKYVKQPQIAAQEQAKKQQEELNKMVRHGEVTDVKPDEITVKVQKGGGDIGKTITATINQYTSVQIGMNFVNKPDETTDLTKYFKKGDSIDMIYKDGQAMALHRDLRPGETVNNQAQNQSK